MKNRILLAVLLLLGLAACGQETAPGAQQASTAAATPASSPPHRIAAVSEAVAAPAPATAVEAGVHYVELPAPRPTETGSKIEVIEFFWYACPHCSSLQEPLAAWLKRKPADVELRRIPAVLDSSWLQLARTYYTIEAMGLVDKLHHDMFLAIHRQKTLDPRSLSREPKLLFDWVAARGVDRQKFMDTYNSFAVSSRTQRAADLTRGYDVPHTPVLVVNGRYVTSPSMKGNGNPNGSANYELFFNNLDQIIALARGKPGAPRK